jgi:hypothetical protein
MNKVIFALTHFCALAFKLRGVRVYIGVKEKALEFL